MAPLIEGFHPGYERKGIYTIEEVFAQFGNLWALFDGDVVPVVSLRYKTFQQSRFCVSCGIEGTYFAKERSAKVMRAKRIVTKVNGERIVTVIPPEVPFKATSITWHFNLYATAEDGREILMTKDHIIPRAKGGPDSLENMQTMCAPCNCKKADKIVYQTQLPFGQFISL